MAGRTVRIPESKARSLLKQSGWLLLVCVAAFAVFIAYLAYKDMDGIAFALFAVYWFSGVGYLIWLGRLASGLGRSVIYYVGGTLLASSAILLLAHLIAYGNIKRAVAESFPARAA